MPTFEYPWYNTQGRQRLSLVFITPSGATAKSFQHTISEDGMTLTILYHTSKNAATHEFAFEKLRSPDGQPKYSPSSYRAIACDQAMAAAIEESEESRRGFRSGGFEHGPTFTMTYELPFQCLTRVVGLDDKRGTRVHEKFLDTFGKTRLTTALSLDLLAAHDDIEDEDPEDDTFEFASLVLPKKRPFENGNDDKDASGNQDSSETA